MTPSEFPVPIYCAETYNKKFQPRLEEVFEELRDTNKLVYRKDWNSHKLSDPTFEKNFLDDYGLEEFKKELHNHIVEYLEQVKFRDAVAPIYKITSSWLTYYQNRDYAITHNHGPADISGAYYVKTNGNDGDIFFVNPLKQLTSSYCFSNCYSELMTVRPKVGTLLLFPGWLDHGVMSNTTDNERVSISFNIAIERK